MPAPVYIGDEISAAGFRLAGVRIRTPKSEDVAQTLAWACDNASLVMLSETMAMQLTEAELQGYLSRLYPPVVMLPEIRSLQSGFDLLSQLRSRLGVLE
ncbi:MAG: V-type ATP synthase subunit F [Gammaproteobacteria bacterium]|nr:V-type ATP synthase subunit F [Gammaproteobacteria bacterium]MDH5800690.1 V-type ATP synthase subunit F [Gammaproteobacteria bacterium]